jgi:hypothetical protein
MEVDCEGPTAGLLTAPCARPVPPAFGAGPGADVAFDGRSHPADLGKSDRFAPTSAAGLPFAGRGTDPACAAMHPRMHWKASIRGNHPSELGNFIASNMDLLFSIRRNA